MNHTTKQTKLVTTEKQMNIQIIYKNRSTFWSWMSRWGRGRRRRCQTPSEGVAEVVVVKKVGDVGEEAAGTAGAEAWRPGDRVRVWQQTGPDPSGKGGVHINAKYAIYKLLHMLHIKLYISAYFYCIFLHVWLIESRYLHIYCIFLAYYWLYLHMSAYYLHI